MDPLRTKLVRLAYSMPVGSAKRELVALLRQADGPDFRDWDGRRIRSGDPTDINWQEALWRVVLMVTTTGEGGGRVYYRKWGDRKLTALLDGLQKKLLAARSYGPARKAVDDAATVAYRIAAKGGWRNTKSWGASSPLETMERVAEGLDKVVQSFPKRIKRWDETIELNHSRQERWDAEQRQKAQDPEGYADKQERQKVRDREFAEAFREDYQEVSRKQESYDERKRRERGY